MMRPLLFAFFSLFSTTLLFGQTSLAGKVTDADNGEPLEFATVALYKNGVLITGTDTDIDGNYSFSNIDPGTYDVDFSFTGYQPQRMAGVIVLAGKANKLDMQLSSGVVLEEIVVVEYKVPLIEQDNTTSGAVITSDQIKQLPTRNINALAATSAGISSVDEGDAIYVRGSRSNATDYYVDGIRVQGNLIPESEIDQLQVITGGVEAQYGDVTGGIISITTKGPSNTFSGGIELESSQFLDAFNNNLIGFNLSGPIARNKRGESILGYRLAGRFTYNEDDDPPGVNVYRIKDDKLAELETDPILSIGGNPFVAADFLKADDVAALDAQPFEESRRYDLTAKLDARLSRGVDISLSGAYADSRNRFTPGEGSTSGANWRVLNSHNNPLSLGQTFRGNFRFRHRLGGGAAGSQSTSGRELIQNASYTLQVGYERTQGDTYDHRHETNYFNYGHVGQFDIEWVPTFVQVFNPELQQFQLIHTDNRQVLRRYTPGPFNPVLANYNKAMGINFEEQLNGQIDNFIITNVGEGAGNVLNRLSFYAPNGGISGIFTNSWGFHSNVGTVFNLASKAENDIYTFSGNAAFDLVAGSSDKGRHNIQIGFWYEQRINRGYNIFPVGLWDIARQQANSHIQGIEPENPDTLGLIDVPNFPETPLLSLRITEGADNKFYQAVREVTGQPLDQYVNVDGLSPDQLRLDMFSAKELNDQGIIDYFGYDYLGNPFDGTFEDFFTAVDINGVRTFPVAPNRPVYAAAYLQDKFTFRDIIFRLGVRIDRYDANTKVLKDPYSLYEIIGAGDYHSASGGEKPGNIGDDFKVYLDDAGSSVVAYRDGDQWFQSTGVPVNNPTEIKGFAGGLVFPRYKDERVLGNPNFIKDRAFDPDVSFTDYEAQVNIMPRLAFSFPISSDANFFAHYDILVQRPPSNTLATPRDYFYFTDITYGPNNPLNNPNLKPERTIDYEVGFQQKLSDASAIKITAYYKEMRDMIQVRTLFPVPLVNGNSYTTYDNIDFGTVKGFSFNYDLRRTRNVTFNANYTLQFADGTGSDANSQRSISSRGVLRTLFPLDFDERHRFVANMDFRYGSGRFYDGPRIFGKEIFANAGINLQAIAVSGRPYTSQLTPLQLGGATTAGSINGARKPWNFTINLRIDKTFRVWKNQGVNVYARVSNLLDRKNIINVYRASGSAEDDGFLATPEGEDNLESIERSVREVDSYLASYQWRILNPNFFSLPRRIFVGAIFDF